MHDGRCVEAGTLDGVLRAPRHAYTRALVSAVRSLEAPRAPEVPA
jgi:ABC-type oligopeptide transport system ATPase subunit